MPGKREREREKVREREGERVREREREGEREREREERDREREIANCNGKTSYFFTFLVSLNWPLGWIARSPFALPLPLPFPGSSWLLPPGPMPKQPASPSADMT